MAKQIPYDTLTSAEKLGNGRGQSVFADRFAAQDAFVTCVNDILSSKNVMSIDGWDSAFPEDVNFWERANYRKSDYSSVEFTQVVRSREYLDDITFSMVGDLVRVVDDRADPIDNAYSVSAYYVWDGSSWIEVGVDGTSVAINASLFETDRDRVIAILAFLDIGERNRAVFSLLHEMLAQSRDCSWFFKTSYVDIANRMTISQPLMKPIDELPLVLQNLNEAKPYRTKIRDVITTVVPSDNEEAVLDVIDTQYSKITMLVDRLNGSTDEDLTWDSRGWDTGLWDEATWTYDSLGTEEWEEVSRFTATTGNKTYNVTGVPGPYALKLTRDDNTPTPTHVLYRTGDDVRVEFTRLPGNGKIFVLYAARGVSEGRPPILPGLVTAQFDWMRPSEQTYEHAYARVSNRVSGTGSNRTLVNTGSYADFAGVTLDDANPDGSDTEERARAQVADPAIVTVTTFHTPSYGTWDATPWDSSPWDSSIEYPPYEFSVVANGLTVYHPPEYDEAIQTVRSFTMGAEEELFGAMSWGDTRITPYRVSVDAGSGFSDVDFTIVMDTPSLVFSDPTMASSGNIVRVYTGLVALLNQQCEVVAPANTSVGSGADGVDLSLSNSDAPRKAAVVDQMYSLPDDEYQHVMSWTLEFTIEMIDLGTQAIRHLVRKGTTDSNTLFDVFIEDDSDNTLKVAYSNSVGDTVIVTTTALIEEDTPYRIAVSGSDEEFNVYVDGLLVGTQAVSGYSVDSWSSIDLGNANTTFRVSEFRFWSVVRDAYDIKKYAMAEMSGIERKLVVYCRMDGESTNVVGS